MNYHSTLNEFDILDLLNEYHSEMRKLQHKAAFVQSKISELERELELIKQKKNAGKAKMETAFLLTDEAKETPENLQSEPAVVPSKVKAAQKGSQKPKKKKVQRKKPGRKPQPLSQWDQMIFDSIAENGRIMLSKDIYIELEKKAKEAGVFESEDHARVKLNQCLVKMTSVKRKDLYKVNHPGRGYAYAIPQWVDDTGNALPEFQLKAKKVIKKVKKATVKAKTKAAEKPLVDKAPQVEEGKSKPKRRRISKSKPEASSSPGKKEAGKDSTSAAESKPDVAPQQSVE